MTFMCKIYKISPIADGDEGDIYIGHTKKHYLSDRFDFHLISYAHYKASNGKGKLTVHSLFDKYGKNGLKIELLEEFEACDMDEVNCKEAFYIRNTKCVNKVIPGRTKKQYYDENQDKIKAYYQNNKVRIQKIQRSKVTCDCGTIVCKDALSKHMKTNKNNNLMK